MFFRETNKFFHKKIDFAPKTTMHLSVAPCDFDDITKEYVEELIKIVNPSDQSIVVLDQPFPVGKKDTYLKYFKEEVKEIDVLRDPRDIYVSAKKIYGTYSSWIPTGNVEDFVKYFKLIYGQKKSDTNDRIYVYFEDLIYRYDETVIKLSEFLGTNIENTKEYFDKDRSVNNTQLFRKYLDLADDIKYIESSLKEYLFDYTDFDEKKSWSESF